MLNKTVAAKKEGKGMEGRAKERRRRGGGGGSKCLFQPGSAGDIGPAERALASPSTTDKQRLFLG